MAQVQREEIPDFDETQDIPDFDPTSDIPDYTPEEEPSFISKAWSKAQEPLQRFLTGTSPEFERMLQEKGITRVEGTPESEVSILPEWKSQPETFTGGFLKSLYEDILRPFGTPSGVLGFSTPTRLPKGNIIDIIPGEFRVKGAQKLLPSGRGGEFISGPGGAQIRSIVESNPQELARVQGAGELLPERVAPIRDEFADLDMIREQNRLRGLYTGQEQLGGSRLEVPDKPFISAPPVAGETRLGFRGVSEADLPYPENIVPEALRPRSAQEVTRALGGEEFARPLEEGERITFGNELIKKAPREIPSPEAPGILPSAPIKSMPRKAAENTGLNIDDMTVSRVPPVLQEPVAKLIVEESKMPSPWRAVRTVLGKLSPELARKDKRAVQLTRQYDAQWIPAFESSLGKLSKVEKENFGGYVEGSIPITSPTVQKAVDIWRTIESSIGDEATRVGLRLYSGKKHVPFIKNEQNYWPRIPKEKLSEEGLLGKLMEGGMTRSEANRVIKHYQKEGELVIGPQHARTIGSKVPYRLDADAGLIHARSMAKRIAQHREFGPLDVEGRGHEGIADLIEDTSDPKLTLKLMQRIIGREERPNTRLNRMLDLSRKYAALTKLQNFTLPNMILGQGPTALRASSYPVESIKEVFKLFGKRYREDLAKSGVWQNFNYTLTEELSKMDPYLIGAGETFNRGIAGAVGKAVAREAHRELRKDLSNVRARKELSELVLEDIDSLVRQDELNSAQMNMAAGRMAEITQGLNVPGNLPYFASDPVVGVGSFAQQLMLQFKKMGYQATKSVWDSIDPRKVGAATGAKNLALWIAVSQIGGELTGDVKSLFKGAWKGDVGTEVEERGNWWLEGSGISPIMIEEVSNISGVEPEIIARMLDNFTQYFFLGLPADLLMSSAYGPYGLMQAAAGPVISDVSKFLNKAVRGDIEGLGKEAVKALPVPGSTGLAEFIFEED